MKKEGTNKLITDKPTSPEHNQTVPSYGHIRTVVYSTIPFNIGALAHNSTFIVLYTIICRFYFVYCIIRNAYCKTSKNGLSKVGCGVLGGRTHNFRLVKNLPFTIRTLKQHWLGCHCNGKRPEDCSQMLPIQFDQVWSGLRLREHLHKSRYVELLIFYKSRHVNTF